MNPVKQESHNQISHHTELADQHQQLSRTLQVRSVWIAYDFRSLVYAAVHGHH